MRERRWVFFSAAMLMFGQRPQPFDKVDQPPPPKKKISSLCAERVRDFENGNI